MSRRLIRAGVSTNAPREVVEEFLREYCVDNESLPKAPSNGLAFYSATYDGLEIQTLDDYIRMVGEYLPDGKREGIVFETRPWQYELSQLHED
jgi:hypothetical protein|nr:MAG TPA: hypothetical protein [Caudoviricetes sp.]